MLLSGNTINKTNVYYYSSYIKLLKILICFKICNNNFIISESNSYLITVLFYESN